MADQVRINGNVFSWGSISVKAGGERFHGFTAIKYADKRERSYVYGMARHHAPQGRTRGKYTPEPVGLTGRKSSMDALRAKLAQLSTSGTSFGDVEFEIVVQYVEKDETPITDELVRCTWTGNTVNHEEGPDGLSEEAELSCMFIRWNGRTLFDESEGTP